MSCVKVTLTLPSGVTKHSHPVNEADGILPALRQAVKNCQAQLNDILTDVVEAERAQAKSDSVNKSKKAQVEEEEDDDEDEDDDDEDGDEVNDLKNAKKVNCEDLESPAKRPKLDP